MILAVCQPSAIIGISC